MADKVAKAGKPQLRGLLHSQIKLNLGVAVGLCIASGILFKFFVNDPHKSVYANFYKSYDIDRAFNTIRNKGLFDSCSADK